MSGTGSPCLRSRTPPITITMCNNGERLTVRVDGADEAPLSLSMTACARVCVVVCVRVYAAHRHMGSLVA
jgi:hypothetical protein